MKRIMNKLVRDNIITMIENQNKKCQYEYLDDESFEKYLREKILEEAKEVYDCDNTDKLIEEIADVLEVLDALIEFHNLDMNVILKVKNQKNLTNGKFQKRILLKEIEDTF